MKVHVGVTDRGWVDFLRTRPDLDEVNFWQPRGGRSFRSLDPGDMFLFKLRFPQNVIVGGGTFVRHTVFPAWLVWEAFGEKNGAATFDDMQAAIARLRRTPLSDAGTEPVGCIILEDPFFLRPDAFVRVPPDWPRQAVQGKTYSDTTADGRRLIGDVIAARSDLTLLAEVRGVTGSMYGPPQTILPRRGQGAFKLLVLDAYGRRCAVSGEKALPTLQAAHIRPVSEGGRHMVPNGLLLRSDVHALYDKGYVTITPAGVFKASHRLKTDFDNGEPYYALENRVVNLPVNAADRPLPEALQWHFDHVFRR